MSYNVALAVVSAVVAVAVFIVNVYVLINYQHPDDYNQAYFPKFVVVFGLSIAQLSILMLPADVANRNACKLALLGACKLTLPMRELWYAVYIITAVLVFIIIPFSMFFYEADQDKSLGQRILSGVMWTALSMIVCALVLGILYGLVGYADFSTRRLVSTTSSAANMLTDFETFKESRPCVRGGLCSAYHLMNKSKFPRLVNPEYVSNTTWTLRVSFPMYIIALTTIIGSLLFSIFGGVGIISLPLDCIFGFLRRPKAIITRSQYIKEATELGKRAKDVQETALALQREERSGNKGRTWKKNMKQLEQAVLFLEEDREALEEMYPQGEQAEMTWALTVLGYLGKLIFGIIGLIISIAWLIHIVINMLIYPPLSPFLNQVFIKLDGVFGLFGTAAFAAFCFYLLLATIAGEMRMGLNFVFLTVHPMKWNGTLMSSFLFNVGLILLCSTSVIQFCATAFSKYAQDTTVLQIFGHQLTALRGIKYLFLFNVFQIAFVAMAGLTFMFYLAFGLKKQKRKRLGIKG